MRRFIRPVTEAEQALVAPHVGKDETLLGVHTYQDVYVFRKPDGTLRFIAYNRVKPSIVQRMKNFFTK